MKGYDIIKMIWCYFIFLLDELNQCDKLMKYLTENMDKSIAYTIGIDTFKR